jgi:hypothetical protein
MNAGTKTAKTPTGTADVQPVGKTGAMPQEMKTMTTTNVTKATVIAKTVSTMKDTFSAEARTAARKLLARANNEREAMLSRWVPAMASALGEKNPADATLETLAKIVGAASVAPIPTTAPTAPKAKAEPKAAPKAKDEPKVEPKPAPAPAPAPVTPAKPKVEAKPATNAKAHAPKIADVAKAISQAEGKHLGDLCGWALTGSRPKADVERLADAYGLTDDLAFPKLTPNACYRKAIQQVFSVGTKDQRRAMAYLVEDSADKLVHAIVTSKVVDGTDDTVSAKDASFTTEIKIGFDKAAYRNGATAEACLVSEDPNHASFQELRTVYIELAEKYLTNDIRNAFQAAFRAWDACPLLPHGGLWYIPANRAEKVRAWHGFMTDLGMTTVVIPAFDTAETIASLRDATRAGLEGQLADLFWMFEQYDLAGWETVRTSTLETRVADFEELRNRAELYQAILGTTADDLKVKVAAAADRLTNDITKRHADEAAAEAKAQAEKEEAAEAKAEAKAAAKAAEKAEKDAAKADADAGDIRNEKAPRATGKASTSKAGRKVAAA